VQPKPQDYAQTVGRNSVNRYTIAQLIQPADTMSHPEFPRPSGMRHAICLALTLVIPPVFAQPLLHCEITYAATTYKLDERISHDPGADVGSDTGGAYINEASDIGGRFRFKAVLLGTAAQLNTVKLYAYYETDRQPLLLSEVKYVAPFHYSATPNSLTGVHYLYSPPLGRELQYGCALTKDRS